MRKTFPKPKLTSSISKSSQPFFQKKSDVSVAEKPFFQAKLNIGQPGDKYEQEADAMADAIVSNQKTPDIQSKEISSIQKMEEEEESVQMMEEEEEELQMKSETSNRNSGNTQLSDQLNQSKGSGSTLSDNVRSEMESSFGVNFSQVKIHTNSSAIQMNKNIGAQAFTHGSDVYFNEGKYNPTSFQGKKLLAHELTHVVQQRGGAKSIQRQQAPEVSEQAQEDSRTLFHQADEAYRNEEYERAIMLFQQLLHSPGFINETVERKSSIAYNIGMASLRLRRVAAANFYFELYQQYHPDDEVAATRIQEARQGLGMNSREVTSMEGSDTENARRVFRRAMTHFNNGNFITAIILFERSRLLGDLSPEQNAEVLYNIGVANLRLGRHATAITYFQMYRRLHPNDETAEARIRQAQEGAGITSN